MIATPRRSSRLIKQLLCCLGLLVLLLLPGLAQAEKHAAGVSVVAENLLRGMIQGVEGREIVVSLSLIHI